LSLFFPKSPDEPVNGTRFKDLYNLLEEMEKHKVENDRNFWQGEQKGGRGEPFYRNPEVCSRNRGDVIPGGSATNKEQGFEKAIRIWIQTGRQVFAEKWGYEMCDLVNAGKKIEKAWEYPPPPEEPAADSG
jgi:hypothetical protein